MKQKMKHCHTLGEGGVSVTGLHEEIQLNIKCKIILSFFSVCSCSFAHLQSHMIGATIYFASNLYLMIQISERCKYLRWMLLSSYVVVAKNN